MRVRPESQRAMPPMQPGRLTRGPQRDLPCAMAKPRKTRKKPTRSPSRTLWGAFGHLLRRAVIWFFGAIVALVVIYWVINPPTTWTIMTDPGPVAERSWVGIEDISPVMLRAVVAAEDANFCNHWGFDMVEIRRAIRSGSSRGASTLSQQVVKNVWLWQGRSWLRKALEASITPVMEAIWPKRRVLEVYLNVAEFGPGIYGIHAAAQKIWGTTPDRLSPVQAARLAAVLPNPKERDPVNAVPALRRRAAQILDGAATIRADGRDRCFIVAR